MPHNYTRLETVDAGTGATEHWWQLVSRLQSHADPHVQEVPELSGVVHSAFDRSLYLQFPSERTGRAGKPLLTALGRNDLRQGPLLTRLRTTPEFSFLRQGCRSDSPVTVRLSSGSPDDSTPLTLTIDNRLRIDIDLSKLRSLPVSGGWSNDISRTDINHGSRIRSQHSALVTRMADERLDGLDWFERLESHLDGHTDEQIASLSETFVQQLTSSSSITPSPKAITDLIGRGPGATPAGDDLLCGLLVTLRAVSSPGQQCRLWSITEPLIETAHRETTAVSAAMLAEAAKGRASKPVRDSLVCLLSQPPTAEHARSDDVLDDLMTIGHTSGADVLAGILTATTVVVPALVAAESPTYC